MKTAGWGLAISWLIGGWMMGYGFCRLVSPRLVIHCDNGHLIEASWAESDGKTLSYIQENSFMKLSFEGCKKFTYHN